MIENLVPRQMRKMTGPHYSMPNWDHYHTWSLGDHGHEVYWSPRYRRYVLECNVTFWPESVGTSVFLMSQIDEVEFIKPYLYIVRPEDVGRTPKHYKGEYHFIDSNQHIIQVFENPDPANKARILEVNPSQPLPPFGWVTQNAPGPVQKATGIPPAVSVLSLIHI